MNKIVVSGKVLEAPIFSHEIKGEKFYEFYMASKRFSGVTDFIPCIVPEVFLDKIDSEIEVVGEIRTRNIRTSGKNHLQIRVFVKDINPFTKPINRVEIDGYICKLPILRTTPLGKTIADVLIASNRANKCNSDYIPSIFWGRNALRIAQAKVADNLVVVGRFQSRTYKKILSDTEFEIRTAYEVSVFSIKNNFRNGGKDNE